MGNTTIYAANDRSPQSVWSLVMSTGALYSRFWRQFLLASGSVMAAIWLSVGISVALGRDLRDTEGVQFLLVLAGLYCIIALVATMAGEACQKGSISLVQAYRTSWLGFMISVAVVAGVALAIAPVLLIPLAGVIAAFYIFVRLSPAFEMALINHSNPFTALRSAWTLTKGRFWRSLLEVVLPQGYLLAIVAILALLPHVALDALLIVIALPAFAIFRVLVYLELLSRERREGAPEPKRTA